MALEAFALTTLSTVKTELGISGSSLDTVLERLINAVSDAFCRASGRRFHYTAGIAERVPAYGDPFLILARPPIVDVDEVVYLTVAGTVTSSIASDQYQRDDDLGTLYHPNGWGWSTVDAVGIPPSAAIGWERAGWRVTYDGGYVCPNQAGTRTLPWDIEQAVIESVVATYKSRSRDYTVQSESYPETSVTYGSPTTEGSSGLLTARAQSVARSYARFRRA